MSTDLALTNETLDLLAYEVALQYYHPNDLATYYGLRPEQLEAIQEVPQFAKRVMDHRRKIDEEGTKSKLAARKLVADTIPELVAIIYDENASYSDRIAAFKEIKSLADIAKTENDAGDRFQLNIQVNT